MVTIYHHPSSQQHWSPSNHPECPERINAIKQRLLDDDQAWSFVEAQVGSLSWYQYAHPVEYLQTLEQKLLATQAMVFVDADTFATNGTLNALQCAAGMHQQAIDSLHQADTARVCFCLHRPPGHHAETTTAMGFCWLNHAANSALYAQASKRFQRPAILDFDVHHGNGTEQIIRAHQADIFFASTFEQGNYPPQSLTVDQPNQLQIALRPAFEGADFQQAWQKILTRTQGYQADLLILSAGFDAHQQDPLSGSQLQTQDYHWLAQQIAKQLPVPTLISLEGGYHLQALAESVCAFLGGFRD